MKSILLLTVLSFSINAYSQITIESIDLPQPGQEYYRSTADNPTIDLTQTGPSQVWDYRNLQRASRDTMVYHTVSQTPIFYQFKFNNPVDPPYYASEAKHTPDVNLGGFLDMTDNYTFSKNTSTEWTEIGIGTTVSGAPFPTHYSDIKTKLKLPLNYQDVNTDDYSYIMTIPTFGTQGQDGTQSYVVDGWGIIKTPAGSYQALRVKTELVKSDTIYIDLVNFGLRIPATQTIYEWYSIAEGYPILTVIEQAGQIISAVFKDDMTVGINNTMVKGKNVVFPNPVNNVLNLKLNQSNLQVTILDISGNIIYQSQDNSPKQIDVSFLSSGIYFVKTRNESSQTVLQFIKN